MSQPLIFDLGSSWNTVLSDELQKPYIQDLQNFLSLEQFKGHLFFPPPSQIFSAFQKTPFESVRVVIIGQDPYHGEGQAHGLSFSVPSGTKPPRSLKNIYKELQSDLGIAPRESGDLTHWAEQGVLLLNTTLTVRQGAPLSHNERGWERLTDRVIEKLSEREERVIFVLWGKHAQKRGEQLSSNEKHTILKAAHPSPFSAHRGFFGSAHFSKINQILKKEGNSPIDW